MYVFKKALALPKGEAESWVDAQVDQMSTTQLLANYSEIYFQLTNEFLTKPQILKLSDVALTLGSFTGTFAEWLVSLGNKTLQTVDGDFVLESGRARFRDAFYAGFTVQPMNALYHPTEELSLDQKVDLLLTRDGVDYTVMEQNVLATVNGLFHRTGSSERGFMVYEGGRSSNHCNRNQLGLLNFQAVSSFKCYSIEKDWFLKPLPLLPYSDRFFLRTPVSTFNKSVLLVIAGWLVYCGDGFTKYNDNTLNVHWGRLSMIDRYQISNRLLDLTDRVPSLKTVVGDRRLTEELLSDDFVMDLCTLPQSFLIVFDEPGISINRSALERLGLPGRWLAHQEPYGLLQVSHGYTPEYTLSVERGKYVVQAREQYRKTLVTTTVRRNDLLQQDELVHGLTQHELDQAHMVEFTKERVKLVSV